MEQYTKTLPYEGGQISESQLLNLNLGFCINCHQRRLGLQIINYINSRCNKHGNKEMHSHANKVLPTWINDQG